MSIKNARLDILRQAAKHGNQIVKLKTADGGYIKGYSSPEETRFAHITALDSLLTDGSLKIVFQTQDLEVYSVHAPIDVLSTLAIAKQRILDELQLTGSVYKIHSGVGEFIQCGEHSFDEFEYERIIFMRAIYDLLHHGKITIVRDSHEMCRFALAPHYKRLALLNGQKVSDIVKIKLHSEPLELLG